MLARNGAVLKFDAVSLEGQCYFNEDFGKLKTGDLLRGGKGRVLDPLTNLHYSLEPERACLTHLGGHPVLHN